MIIFYGTTSLLNITQFVHHKIGMPAKHLVNVMWQVSLDLVKGLYAKFIEWDVEMIDQETGTASYAAK